MTIFNTPNPTPYLNLTTTLLTINKQQLRSLSFTYNKNSSMLNTNTPIPSVLMRHVAGWANYTSRY